MNHWVDYERFFAYNGSVQTHPAPTDTTDVLSRIEVWPACVLHAVDARRVLKSGFGPQRGSSTSY